MGSSTIYGWQQKILDRWSAFRYKERFGMAATPAVLPSWINDEDRARLEAYAMLTAYCMNSSRWWLSPDSSDQTESRREYGDPDLLVDMALSSLLGDRWRITTDDAIGIEVEDQATAVEQHEAIMAWSEKEKFGLKLVESERQSVRLGDSVYVLGWDAEKQRVRLNVYDPGFYFPVFNDFERGGEDFPHTIFIAYEFLTKDSMGKDVTRIRRISWKLVDVEEYTPGYWNDGQTETKNCLYEDAIWDLDSVTDDLAVMQSGPVQTLTEQVFLNIGFIPVVHIPNTVSLQEHFGESVLESVLQLLDDVQSTDTDIQASSATTGSPPVVVSGTGSGGDHDTIGPGEILYVGDGSATILDTSRSLDALLKLKDGLLERLSVNSRTPESLLGRVKPNEVPSGIALTLSFTPHASLVKEMRMVRTDKYDLLFRFVVRFMQQANQLTVKQIHPTHLTFGSFLPSDKQEVMQLVTQLLTAKAISLETSVQMLVEAGIPIDDWVAEIKRIESRDLDSAERLAALTMDPNEGLKSLGRPEIPTTIVPDEGDDSDVA